MNTSQYLPIDSISYNLLINKEHPEYPFFSGTGFFVYFPPFDDIFYITAKHCFNKIEEDEIDSLRLPYELNDTSKHTDNAISFLEIITGQDKEDNELEDIIIFVVDRDIEQVKIDILKKRSLRLQHQDDIETMIETMCLNNENIRVIGFPKISKEMDYDNKKAIVQPRGYYGKIKNNSKFKYRYGFEKANWKDIDYSGFSGSPILSLNKSFPSGDVIAIPIGILLTATPTRGEFLSINFATNLIAKYLIDKQEKLTKQSSQ